MQPFLPAKHSKELSGIFWKTRLKTLLYLISQLEAYQSYKRRINLQFSINFASIITDHIFENSSADLQSEIFNK